MASASRVMTNVQKTGNDEGADAVCFWPCSAPQLRGRPGPRGCLLEGSARLMAAFAAARSVWDSNENRAGRERLPV